MCCDVSETPAQLSIPRTSKSFPGVRGFQFFCFGGIGNTFPTFHPTGAGTIPVRGISDLLPGVPGSSAWGSVARKSTRCTERDFIPTFPVGSFRLLRWEVSRDFLFCGCRKRFPTFLVLALETIPLRGVSGICVALTGKVSESSFRLFRWEVSFRLSILWVSEVSDLSICNALAGGGVGRFWPTFPVGCVLPTFCFAGAGFRRFCFVCVGNAPTTGGVGNLRRSCWGGCRKVPSDFSVGRCLADNLFCWCRRFPTFSFAMLLPGGCRKEYSDLSGGRCL